MSSPTVVLVPAPATARGGTPPRTPSSPFPRIAEAQRADPSWTVHDLPTTHNVLREGTDVLVGLVEEVLADSADTAAR